MALVWCGAGQTLCQAQEFASFRLTGFDGYVTTSYHTDEFITQQPGFGSTPSATQKQSQNDFRIEAFLMTHSYVYHPKFLTLDVGGGPVFASGSAQSDGMTNRSQRALYNFTARATMLADKPFRGALFYEHLNPTMSLSPGETFNQQTSKYGLDFSLLAPVTPVALNLQATRTHVKGNSVERIVDDRIDQVTLKGERALWSLGATQFGYHAQQQVSASGSPQLPIQNSRLNLQSFNADTRLQLGKDKRFDLYNSIAYTTQKYTLEQGRTPKLDDLRFLLNYRAIHSSAWQSFANYHFNRNRQDENATTASSANAGAVWNASKNFVLSAGLHDYDTRATQFAVRTWGADGSVRYDRSLPLGSGQISYALRYDQREQTASAAQAAIVGERVELNGTSPFALAQTRVSGGSVVVRNTSRTQVFLEGIDYVLTVVGITTRIQRVLSGNILDGDVVLIDYTFDTGGAYSSTQLDQNLNLNWAPSRFLSVYLRYTDSAPQVTAGAPSSPLNAINSTLFGARADVPLSFAMDFVAGGFFERESHRETIAPYTRSAGEVYLQGDIPFLAAANFRAATRRTRVYADNALQNVNLTGYDLMLGWRHSSGVLVTAAGLYERDSGGLENRVRRSATLKALWRFRRITLTMDLSRTRETQGVFTRERTVGQLIVRRDF